MKNAFDGLISRLDMAKERIFELEDNDGRNFPTERQREKGLGKQNKTDYSRLFVVVGQLQRV